MIIKLLYIGLNDIAHFSANLTKDLIISHATVTSACGTQEAYEEKEDVKDLLLVARENQTFCHETRRRRT